MKALLLRFLFVFCAFYLPIEDLRAQTITLLSDAAALQIIKQNTHPERWNFIMNEASPREKAQFLETSKTTLSQRLNEISGTSGHKGATNNLRNGQVTFVEGVDYIQRNGKPTYIPSARSSSYFDNYLMARNKGLTTSTAPPPLKTVNTGSIESIIRGGTQGKSVANSATAQAAKPTAKVSSQPRVRTSNLQRAQDGKLGSNKKYVLKKADLDLKAAEAVRQNSQYSHARRDQLAKETLGRELSPKERQGVLKAHNIGARREGAGVYNYTSEEIARKARKLKAAGFSADERRILMRNGVVGQMPGQAPTNTTQLETQRVEAVKANKSAQQELAHATRISESAKQKLIQLQSSDSYVSQSELARAEGRANAAQDNQYLAQRNAEASRVEVRRVEDRISQAELAHQDSLTKPRVASTSSATPKANPSVSPQPTTKPTPASTLSSAPAPAPSPRNAAIASTSRPMSSPQTNAPYSGPISPDITPSGLAGLQLDNEYLAAENQRAQLQDQIKVQDARIASVQRQQQNLSEQSKMANADITRMQQSKEVFAKPISEDAFYNAKVTAAESNALLESTNAELKQLQQERAVTTRRLEQTRNSIDAKFENGTVFADAPQTTRPKAPSIDAPATSHSTRTGGGVASVAAAGEIGTMIATGEVTTEGAAMTGLGVLDAGNEVGAAKGLVPGGVGNAVAKGTGVLGGGYAAIKQSQDATDQWLEFAETKDAETGVLAGVNSVGALANATSVIGILTAPALVLPAVTVAAFAGTAVTVNQASHAWADMIIAKWEEEASRMRAEKAERQLEYTRDRVEMRNNLRRELQGTSPAAFNCQAYAQLNENIIETIRAEEKRAQQYQSQKDNVGSAWCFQRAEEARESINRLVSGADEKIGFVAYCNALLQAEKLSAEIQTEISKNLGSANSLVELNQKNIELQETIASSYNDLENGSIGIDTILEMVTYGPGQSYGGSIDQGGMSFMGYVNKMSELQQDMKPLERAPRMKGAALQAFQEENARRRENYLRYENAKKNGSCRAFVNRFDQLRRNFYPTIKALNNRGTEYQQLAIQSRENQGTFQPLSHGNSTTKNAFEVSSAFDAQATQQNTAFAYDPNQPSTPLNVSTGVTKQNGPAPEMSAENSAFNNPFAVPGR